MAARLRVRVVPRASRNAVVGWLGEELKISVTAPPERGKANAAVIEVLARALSAPERSFRIVRGETSASKILEIDNLSPDEIHRRLRTSIS